jgi:hypothetical protein
VIICIAASILRDIRSRPVHGSPRIAQSQSDALAADGPLITRSLSDAASDYRLGHVDYAMLVTAWREVLQIQLQVAQVEVELGKTLGLLERAVGSQLNEHPPVPASATDPATAPFSPVVPATSSGPLHGSSTTNPGRIPSAPTAVTRAK